MLLPCNLLCFIPLLSSHFLISTERLEQRSKFYCISSLFSKLPIGEIGEAPNYMQLLITLTVTALHLTSVLVLAGAELIFLTVACTGLFQIGTENRFII